MSLFKNNAIGNAIASLAPVIVAIAVILDFNIDPFSPIGWTSLTLLMLGYVLLVKVKWPQIREGNFWTFGISDLSGANKRLYRLSYTLMGVSLLLLFFA